MTDGIENNNFSDDPENTTSHRNAVQPNQKELGVVITTSLPPVDIKHQRKIYAVQPESFSSTPTDGVEQHIILILQLFFVPDFSIAGTIRLHPEIV